MTKSELQQLILACRKNDLSSQKQIYRHFYNYGMTICFRYAQHSEEAREILNDGFVKALTKLDQYTPTLSFKAWLNKILVNTAIDHYRKKQSSPQTVDLIYAQHIETSAGILDELSTQDILKMVQQLSPAYRMVFSLYVVEGFKHKEIAQKLGISVGTSKSNLAKARIKLKAMMQLLDEKKSKYG